MIIVFGSLNMDLILPVSRLPAPGETVLTASYQAKPGGKGNNQAVAARRAGGRVAMVGCVGRDSFGSELKRILAGEGIDITALATAATPTGIAAIGIDAQGENSIIVASGANLQAQASQLGGFRFDQETTLVLQMEIPPQVNWAALGLARQAGARTIVNLAPATDIAAEMLALVDVLVLNEIELGQLTGHRGGSPHTAREGAQVLAQRFGLTCVVTLGAQGCVAATNQAVISVPALPIVPVDTTGAGDAFVGILAAGLDAGLGLDLALRRATVGSALACLGFGAQEALPIADAIDARLGDLPPSS